MEIPALLTSWGLVINARKSCLQPTQEITYLGLTVNLREQTLQVPPELQDRILRAIALAPNLSLHAAQRLAGFVNFVRPVARLPLQLISAILARDGRLTAWAQGGLWSHDWTFSARDYRDWFCRHPGRGLASDATPTQLGLADAVGGITFRLQRPLPIYVSEYLAVLLLTCIAPPCTTLYIDNTAVLYNLHKGRCPMAWLPFLSRWFARRAQSVRYVPTEANPADRASRVAMSDG